MSSGYPLISFAPQGKDARADCVSQARHAITVVTSLWGSGEVGPLTLVLPQNFMTSAQIQEFKNKCPDVHILCTNRPSRFMNSELVIEYYDEVLAHAFEKRRAELSARYDKDFQEEWGMIVCDGFTGHHGLNSGSDVLRS